MKHDFTMIEGPPGPETVIAGKRYLYFGGTGYLGLAGHPEVAQAVCSAARDFGLHSGTARAGIGTSPPVAEVEQKAAEFFGKDDGYYLCSGYLAAHVMISAIAPTVDALLIDEFSHYSMVEACRLAMTPVRTFRHNDITSLDELARKCGRALVIADAVGPVTGEIAPIKEFQQVLQRQEGSALLLDDAHGFGVLGVQGRGTLEQANVWEKTNDSCNDGVRFYVCGTLAKALGGFGGIIPGERDFISSIRSASHYFLAASGPASPVAAGSAKALEIVMREPSLRESLKRNSRHLRAELQRIGLSVPQRETAHLGVTTGDAKQMKRVTELLK
ncbi:MAG TPA: pyridoxal phosphate-dependent aminotransferase family protein, partial [Terriglobia bacterium]|nr:pyridoxal phosphate-dependent aminotransferase family protein [Terriglobia bacterium]